MNKPNLRLLAVLFAAVTFLGAACGGEEELGSGVEINKEGGDGNAALRDERKKDEAEQPAATTAPPTTAAPTTTTRPPATTTTRPTSEIRIQDDQQGKPFDPPALVVRAGRLVRWTNSGSQARSVVADNGAFRSPMLAPGQSFEWIARPGQYNYHDGTRPYAVAQISVQ